MLQSNPDITIHNGHCHCMFNLCRTPPNLLDVFQFFDTTTIISLMVNKTGYTTIISLMVNKTGYIIIRFLDKFSPILPLYIVSSFHETLEKESWASRISSLLSSAASSHTVLTVSAPLRVSSTLLFLDIVYVITRSLSPGNGH